MGLVVDGGRVVVGPPSLSKPKQEAETGERENRTGNGGVGFPQRGTDEREQPYREGSQHQLEGRVAAQDKP